MLLMFYILLFFLIEFTFICLISFVCQLCLYNLFQGNKNIFNDRLWFIIVKWYKTKKLII